VSGVPGPTIDVLAAAIGGHISGGPPTTESRDLTHDSRLVEPGVGFACVRGATTDGHLFAQDAIAAGAAWLVVDTPLEVDVPQIVVGDVRATLGAAAAVVHGDPSARLTVVGVTGTAGKTTVTHALRDILAGAHRTCSVLGTLSGARTTPEATDVQRWLSRRLAAGDDAVAMEVSSHALELGRVDGVRFDVGVFTNLSPEHLDFHHTMDEYYAAKARLFDGRSAAAVVNAADSYGQRLLSSGIAAGTKVLTFGPDDVSDVRLGPSGSEFAWRGHATATALIGRFNLLNLSAAGCAATALGIDETTVATGFSGVQPVRGRMEAVPARGSDITVVVDYSHKPDALRAALEAAREFASGDLWVVFGAGGDRDRAKRPLMGSVADELADHCVVTSDNPRTEDPDAIIEEIVAAMSHPHIHVDRDAAIGAAILGARAGDVVVIAGKGHETHQTIGHDVRQFDDVEVARRHLAQRIDDPGGVR